MTNPLGVQELHNTWTNVGYVVAGVALALQHTESLSRFRDVWVQVRGCRFGTPIRAVCRRPLSLCFARPSLEPRFPPLLSASVSCELVCQSPV